MQGNFIALDSLSILILTLLTDYNEANPTHLLWPQQKYFSSTNTELQLQP